MCPDVGCGVFGNDPEAQLFPMIFWLTASGFKRPPELVGPYGFQVFFVWVSVG